MDVECYFHDEIKGRDFDNEIATDGVFYVFFEKWPVSSIVYEFLESLDDDLYDFAIRQLERITNALKDDIMHRMREHIIGKRIHSVELTNCHTLHVVTTPKTQYDYAMEAGKYDHWPDEKLYCH